ncbi:hypothetical protein PybrP1_009889 [[Pythium] brassicae (nom. inval.)]|nr:hypothetical protein PybrP1_009889 [[Pythium] brassicae (nom. inval.)]
MTELVAGARCYVPDERFVWLPAQVVRAEKSTSPDKPEKTLVLRVFSADSDGDSDSSSSSSAAVEERVMDFNDKQVQSLMASLQLEALPYQNENLGADGIEDMIALNYLHEAAILYNVKRRFLRRLPYTYTGDICIAVNPYQWLPELYADAVHAQYLHQPKDELPPHVYATSVASVAYRYTGDNTAAKIEGMSDAAHFARTQTALGLIGLGAADQDVFFGVLAGILHLGEVGFCVASGNDEAAMLAPGDAGALAATTLLGVSATALETALCSRTIAVSGEVLSTPLRKAQAEECRDALAKAIYSNVFDWLEDKHVIEFPRTSRTQFTIKHYAGAVTYESLGFLEKHKDALLPDLSDLMRGSAKPFLSSVFALKGPAVDDTATRGGSSGSGGGARKPGRAVGGALTLRTSELPRAARCSAVMDGMRFEAPSQYQVGRTRIYFRFGVLEAMEEKRAEQLDAQACRVQHVMRGFSVRLRYLRKLSAIIKLQDLQSVARCVIMMNRYNAFKLALVALQARWRGFQGRRVAAVARKTKGAITIQRHVRGFVTRKQFKRARQSATKIQAFVRMKVQRKKFQALLTEKKLQDNMNVQLQNLQSRLHDEQRRNALLKIERDSATRDSILFAESEGMRSRGKSTAHLWMADADGILSQLHDDANRLRRENDEQRAATAALKNEVEKLKNEKEVLAANLHVKARQYEDTVREKDKKLATMEKELRRLRELAGVANVGSLERTRSLGKDRSKSIFRTLGSKKDAAHDAFGGGGDFDRSSQAMQSSLAQKSADTAQFLKASAQRMTRAKFWGSFGDDDEPDRLSGGDLGDGSGGGGGGGRKSLLQGVGAAGVGAMSTLKGKITAVKGKYGVADALGRPTGADSFQAFALDSEAPLPPGWEARLSRSKGKVYFCNPALKLTQWDRPTVESLKARKLGAVGAQQRARNSSGSKVHSPGRESTAKAKMEALVKELQHDAQLGVFFAPDCSVSAIASDVVARDAQHHPSATTAAAASGPGGASHSERFVLRLDDAVRRIDRAISEHIGANHGTLLLHAGSADALQRRVTDVQASVRQLQLAATDLEAVVAAQHRRLRASLHKHRNVDKCADILRRLLRYHQLSERVLGSSLSVVTGPSTARGRAASSSEHAMLAAAGASNSEELAAELAALALAIREIEALVVDPQFADLTPVRMSLPSVRRVGANIRRDVRASLRAGMQRLSQADVGDALQILFYLGNLSESVQSAVNDVIQDVERKCSTALAEETLASSSSVASTGAAQQNGGGSSGGSALEAAAQKADVWKAVQEVFEVVRVHALQVWNLQRVLVKLQDAGAGRSYLELVVEPDEPALFATFWEVSCAILRELFTATLDYRAALRLVLVVSYPRMREEATRVLNELTAATSPLRTDAELLADAMSAMPEPGHRDALRGVASSRAERGQLLDAMAPLFDAFTDRTYRRLANPIQLMFPQSASFHTSPPGRSDMQTLARTVFSEVDQAGQDPVLLAGALQQIRRAVTLFCANVKRITNTGKAATSTTPTLGRTPAQAHNVSLLNVLHQLDEALSDVAARVASAAGAAESDAAALQVLQALCAQELQPCRELIQGLEYTILGTYLQGLCAILESIFAKMHDESFADLPPVSASSTGATAAATGASAKSGGSRYMAEFNGAFHVVLDEHIRRLPNARFAGRCVSDFVARLISVFLRHAALLRPLEESGKLRLANDMAQLELRLEQLLPLKALGAPYDELRAFRHMVFLDSGAVLRDATVDKIRPTNVWHHLISRAPVELQLPHHMKRWSAAKYVEWLDKSAGVEDRASPPAAATAEPLLLSITQVPLGYPCLKDRRTALRAEKEAWKEVSKCLDAYAQRVSASSTSTSSTAAAAAISPIYDTLLESGGILLAGYEVSLAR